MSETLRFPTNARRAVWVFAADLPEDALESYAAPPAKALREALGLCALDTDHIELFRAEALSDYGLSSFLIEANGIDAASVAPDADTLDALTGPILLVFSGALPAADVTLDPKAPLRFIGRYSEHGDTALRDAPVMATEPTAPPPPNPAASKKDGGSGLIIFAALALIILFLLVFVFGFQVKPT